MFSKAATLALLASMVSAQTFTSCDPTKKTCPDDPAVGGKVTVDFTKGANDFFTIADGTKLEYDDKLGATFSISSDTDAPTISSKSYIFFGRVDITCRISPGQGVVTSSVLQSDDLDEIDWEWLGSYPDEVQSNFFSKGNTSSYDRGHTDKMSDAINTFHTYTIDWTAERVEWLVDGNLIRTLTYADANPKSGYPQTPMQIKLGTWVAGSAKAPQGTVEWAGGRTNYTAAPFKAYYQKLVVTDYMGGNSSAGSYSWSDKTGAWQSIKVSEKKVESSDSTDSSSTSSSTKSATASSNSTSTDSSDSTSTSTSTTAGSASSSGSASHSGSSSVATKGAVSGAASTFTTSGVIFAAGAALFAGLL